MLFRVPGFVFLRGKACLALIYFALFCPELSIYQEDTTGLWKATETEQEIKQDNSSAVCLHITCFIVENIEREEEEKVING